MSRPARSSSLTTTARASWNFSRKRTSIMQVSSGLPHMLTSNQRGRGQEPVIVLGSIRLAVTVNICSLPKVVLAAIVARMIGIRREKSTCQKPFRLPIIGVHAPVGHAPRA